MGLGGRGGTGALCTGDLRRQQFLSMFLQYRATLGQDEGWVRKIRNFESSLHHTGLYCVSLSGLKKQIRPNSILSLSQKTSESTHMQQGDPKVENVQWGPERWAEAAAGLATSLFPSSSPTPVQTHIPAPFPGSSPNCQQLSEGKGDTQ